MPSGCSDASTSGKTMPDTACDNGVTPCKDDVSYKLVSISVISNATQTNVTGAKNWATIKKSTDDIIIQAKTDPDSQAGWQKVQWSGDSGTIVPGQLNQRKLSRDQSKVLHIEAELGGVKDSLDIWVIWAGVTIQTSGTTPKNALQFKSIYLGPDILGAVTTDGFGLVSARGKVVIIGKISPDGINKVVENGWAVRRERISRDWIDGKKNKEGSGRKDLWNKDWVEDTIIESSKLTPTNDPVTGSFDEIFDIDAPGVGYGVKDYETYNNFRQWIEWNNEKCSGYEYWYWKATWKASPKPHITMKEVGTGNIKLPEDSPLHPAKAKK